MSDPATHRRPGGIAALRARYEPLLRGSDTVKAAGLAVAMIANNVIALGSTVVFSRLVDDYGSLAALVKYLIILTVAGQAMQVATAREGVLGHLGVGEGLAETLRRWTRAMVPLTLAVTVVSILLRQPIADLVGVKHYPWAAAAGLPAGCLYLELSLLRGALQGIGDYKSVGLSLICEQATRLAVGALLAAIGLNVTGAYLGSLLSYVAMCLYCAYVLREQLLGPRAGGAISRVAVGLWTHVRGAAIPIAALAVIALLQNVDVIAAKHQFTKDVASSYAAAAVAAQVLIWVAMGAGFYLVPEVSRRRSEGKDTRPVLARALGIILVCSVPVLLIFAFGAKPLLRVGFGANRTQASDSLLVLGVAFTVLACTYLAIQYMLALKRVWFLIAIGAVAAVEPVLLLQASKKPAGFAAVVLAVQAVGAALAFVLALRGRHSILPPPDPPDSGIEIASAVAAGQVLGEPLGSGSQPAEVSGAAKR